MPLLNPPLHLSGQDVTPSRLRSMMVGLQAGVDLPDDLVVTPGTGLAVQVAAGVAFVDDGATTRRSTLYRAELFGAAETVALAAAHATLPRLDQVIAEVLDPEVSGSSALWRLRVLAGTATSGATLGNRTGAATMPARCLRLADVLVTAAASSIPAANVRDRRPHANGQHVATYYSGANIALNSAPAALSPTLTARIELDRPGMIRCVQAGRTNSAAAASNVFAPHVNNVEATVAMGRTYHSVVAGQSGASCAATFDLQLPAGSHLVAMGGGYAAAGAVVLGDGIAWTVQQIVA